MFLKLERTSNASTFTSLNGTAVLLKVLFFNQFYCSHFLSEGACKMMIISSKFDVCLLSLKISSPQFCMHVWCTIILYRCLYSAMWFTEKQAIIEVKIGRWTALKACNINAQYTYNVHKILLFTFNLIWTLLIL